jgi:hypothetical protein
MSDTIAQLFASDPLGHTEKDIDAIIAYERDQRARFELGQKVEKIKKIPAKGALSLEGLGLATKAPVTLESLGLKKE